MAWTYNGDPASSSLNEVRFYLQDVDEDDPLFQDEEINFYITKLDPVFGSLLATASYLADVIANRMARELAISADGVTVGADALQQKYRDIAANLREQWHTIGGAGAQVDVGGILWGEELDPTVKPFVFGKGIDDNFRAGNQEYGGLRSPAGLWPWFGYDDGIATGP